MTTKQTFFGQLFADYAWIVSLIILALCALATASACGVDMGIGNGKFLFLCAAIIAAVFFGSIFFNKEMRAKRGLPPFKL